MAKSVCPRCGLLAQFFEHGDGTSTELSAKPSPEGVFAVRDGMPVGAVRCKDGKVIGRLPGFEKEPLYRGHYVECALESSKKMQGMGRRTGS